MDPVVVAACELLAQDRAFVLATIICLEGSAPRTAGTRMLITAEQEIFGTIGGGLLEARTMQAATRMNSDKPARFMDFDLTHQQAAKMEMICGGRVKVLLDYIQPCAENRRLFNDWRDTLSLGRTVMFLSVVTGDDSQIEAIAHGLFKGGQDLDCAVEVPADLHQKLMAQMSRTRQVHVLNTGRGLVVADPGQITPPLFIFGAGHVARPTAHLAALAGFGVVVLDDRSEFVSADRFPEAETLYTLSSFETAFKDLTVNSNAYVIILTRGHLHDRTVLAQALKTPAIYIGMIGSHRKRDAIYDSLLNDGFTTDDIARVHSPIGLAIGADTPEEIAVSIVAELIAVRSGMKNCL